MKKINRRKFLEKGIVGGVGIVIGRDMLLSIPQTYTGNSEIGSGVSDNLPGGKSLISGTSATGEVPDWMRCPRFYTSDYRREQVMDEAWVTKDGDITERVKKIAANGGSVFRMGVSWGGDMFFQSKVGPHSPRLGKIDYLREAIDQGKKSGVRIVAYINPNALYDGHPLQKKCAIRNSQGKIWDIDAYGIKPTRYPCINNPEYRKFLLDILKEIFTEYKPDGLYVDGLTPHICFCEHCKAKYRKMFNAELPAKFEELGPLCVLWEMTSQPELVGDPRDPDSARYTEFLYRSLTDITRDYTTTVKSCKPDAVTLYHSWPKPETLKYYDGTLGEIYINQPWVHTLWKSGELTNYGTVFPILLLQNMYPLQKTEVENRHKMYQVLANGMLPNCWYFAGMKTCYDFLRDNEQYYDYTKNSPVKFMAFPRAIHEDSVHKRIKKDFGIPGPRDRFLAPYVGFYSAMLRSGLPVVSMHRPDFQEKLAGFKVLCLANEVGITDIQAEAVRRFVAAGGGLIATGETSLYDEKGERRQDFALKDLFGVSYVDTLAAEKRLLEFGGLQDITKGLEKYQIDYDEPLIVVKPGKGKADGWLVDIKREKRSVPVVITNTFGLGRVVYIPARMDSVQCEKLTPAIEKLFANSVYWVAQGNVPVQLKADATVGVTLFDQPGRRVLHLVNYNADTIKDYEMIGPVKNIRIKMSVPDGKKIGSLNLLWQKTKLIFNKKGNWIEYTIPEIGEYEVVVAEFEK
jgi:hypothetical protein